MYDMPKGIAINILAPPAEPVELSGVQYYLMFSHQLLINMHLHPDRLVQVLVLVRLHT